MTLSEQQWRENEENNVRNARVLIETLTIMRGALTVHLCHWCGWREIEVPNARHACAVCDDMLRNC